MGNKEYFEFKVLVEKVRKFKNDKELTYEEFGNGLTINKSHLHRVLNMESYPSFQLLVNLARFMKVPLYSLFMPSKEVEQQEFKEKMQERVREMGLTAKDIADRSGIQVFKIMDILDGAPPTNEEKKLICSYLQIPLQDDSKEAKLTLLENLLDDLGLKDSQAKNIVTYVKDNID